MLKEYAKLMRIHHYIKNVLVFVALGCSGQLFCVHKLMTAIWGFITFCMVSSIVYIVNDIKDLEKDRIHPMKSNRPIASGKISLQRAWGLAIILFFASILCNSLIFSCISSLLLILYLILNLAYSFGLKDKPLIDIIILTAGFLIRMVYGATITEIEISNWLYLTVIALAFYFSLGKRRNELEYVYIGGGARLGKC